ncbi:cytochrome b/b6 domain-containing protein [Yoonia sp.]|uniref:cytochrome b/b6 domain-containing protein n=1 Tax=Yoonia sp. TaxID=2212373 RepID=UPI0025DF9B59|nr:cytochrome b/b6 domain-containing protein [Yoonia sp.]
MPASNTATLYGTVTKTFHWLTALLIITIIPLGLIANDLPYETNAQLAFKAQLFSFHKTLGVIIFAVALARILWALTQTKPGALHPDRKAETMLAEVVHWLLYISLVAVPLTGWIHHAATTGFAPILLPIGQSLPLVPKSEGFADVFATLHWIWSKVMVASILLHIAGALKHQFVDKDATLRRMWFGQTQAPALPAHRGSLVAPIAALGIFALATAAAAAAGFFSHETRTAGPALAAVSSEWAVTDGAVAITVTQFGSPVTGTFADWTSAISFDPDATGVMGNVTTTIAIGSLQLGSVTSQAMGADFFDAETFPTATFAANIIADGDGYVADGTLSIKGNTVPVTLPFALTIVGDTAEMTGTLNLDRRTFEIGQSMSDETNLAFGVGVNVTLSATRSAQ